MLGTSIVDEEDERESIASALSMVREHHQYCFGGQDKDGRRP